MEERARSCLLRHRDTLQQDIKASYLMDHMVSDNVLTHDEEEKVRAKPTRKEQAVTLIDLVLQKDNRAYISVYNALIRESYGDLASLLQPDLPLISPEAQKSFSDGGTPYVNTTLIEGGVPQRPVVFVTRPPLVNQIREKLYRLQDTTGWVTVFGMAGSGKSVLAAEAVRDEAVIKECFPGGVHWLSIGQLELPGLLVKIQSLCFRLEQTLDSSSQRPPNSIEEAKDRLRYLMLYKYPRSLLILDDIWDGAVLKAFDVQCRVLLTTRDRSLVDSVGGQRFEVHVESGLGHKKALEVLALYVNKKPEDLPDQAYSIVRECKCSPLVVSLIGALLHDFPDRWDYYLRQLKMKQFRRIRKSSSYDYEALDQAMDASITVLQEDYQELYKDFTVVKKDVKVPAKVLSIIWNLELEEVEDMLQEFVNKSLLFRDCTHRPYLYYLHDLQLDFLVEQNRSRLQELHSKVVRQYQQFYREGPPISGDQECLYWFRYLTYHMANAGLTQELYTLIFSLDWIKTKAQLMGPVSVINDYVEHGAILENSEVCKQFLEFLSVNGHHLEQKPFPDVVQLGLSQPVSSRVYQEAQLLAQQQTSSGALYLDWVNKSSLESLSRLVIKPLQGFIYYACFSRDGLKIASCGSDNTLQVFRVTSGEKLLDFRAHEDEVLCCAFSPDDRQIATCSSDKKVKLWNAEKGTLIRTFDEEHEEQVNHCQFTNTRRRILLATCSNDSVYNMKLWNPNRQSSQNTLFGHMEPVSHCCFSPDDTYLSTSSSDGTLKLWEVSSANEWKSINVQGILDEDEETETIVKCSSWSADCRRIFCAARNAVFMFDVTTTELLSEIRTNRLSTVQFCDACPNSQLVAVALSHYAVELWDVEAKKKKADCRGHLSSVHCVRFSPDGALLLSSSSDQTFRLWETEKIHTSSAVSLKRDLDVLFDDRDVIIVAPDNKNKLQVRSGNAGDVMFQSQKLESRIRCVCLYRDPLVVALGQEDGVVQVLELPSGKVLHVLSGHTKTVLHCQFNADGHTLITSSEDATLRVWKWRTGECRVLQGHTEQVRRFLLLETMFPMPCLLSWSYDGTVKVWDMSTAEKIQDIVCHQGSILSCDASPDGHLFATTSTDKTAKLWSLQSWRKLHELIGHQDCIRSCRFSWNSSRLATGDDYGEIRLWCVLDGSLLKICSSSRKDSMDSLHGGWVTDLHFSPDNKVLVSTGGYVKWWDVEKGKALQTFYTTGANLKGIHVSPDFGTFVTIDSIGILYILRKM
ncbi:apoptotic protease-activating factor 1 isoform X1 [Scleropages formosus]|nr:apoptotic protease-activating factor 1 isoform X1 [Scleropages formosus]XP_018602816.1 apoptotic protease-activating factor 1 isoform X1 [Scleropages formosus]XP_018602817.1 apoptotic protease-activating factor 1 isoform X1 [Scleropages formosus]